jgi:hypothetical protein
MCETLKLGTQRKQVVLIEGMAHEGPLKNPDEFCRGSYKAAFSTGG